MNNLITIFQNYCTAKGWEYHYGNQYTLNLIDTRGEMTLPCNDKIYFLNELNEESFVTTSAGQTKETLNVGRFLLVVHSDFDKSFYNEKNDLENSRYKDNIEPLRIKVIEFINSFVCTDTEIRNFKMIPVINQKDINFDGWLINYNIVTK